MVVLKFLGGSFSHSSIQPEVVVSATLHKSLVYHLQL